MTLTSNKLAASTATDLQHGSHDRIIPTSQIGAFAKKPRLVDVNQAET